MLIVNVDLVPHGRAAETKTIARIAIANDGPKRTLKDHYGDVEHYHYIAWFSKEDPVGDKLGINNTQVDTDRDPDVCVIHRRDRGALALVRTILDEWDEYEQIHKDAIVEDKEKADRSAAYAAAADELPFTSEGLIEGAPRHDIDEHGNKIYGANW